MRIRIAGTPLPAQLQFLRSRARQLGMFGGYGSGKTRGLIYKVFQLMDLNRGLPGGLLCPTNKMFKRDVYPELRQVCGESGVEFEYRKSDGELYFPTTDSTVYIFHGEDDGESIRGPNLAWFAINEMTLLTRATYQAAVGRVRLKAAPFPQIAGSGTPEDFNWAYDMFIDKPMVGSEVVYADTRGNHHTDASYVQMLLNSYDDVMAQQYVEGKFVPKTGQRAFYKFDRHKHLFSGEVPTGKDMHAEDWVHVDFNVFPMAATLYKYIPQHPKHKLWAYDEVNIHGADTHTLCEILSEKIGANWATAKIYPDYMGGRQKHSSSKAGATDLSIMRDYGFRRQNYKTKYSVRDQMNAANAMLAKDMIVFHKDKCPETIRDLERVKKVEGSHELDKKDPMRTHWADGLKNMCHVEFPVIKGYTETTSQRIR